MTLAVAQSAIRCCAPRLEALASGLALHDGLEGGRVNQCQEAGDVTEAKRGRERRTHRSARGQVERGTQPHERAVLLHRVVDAIQRDVRGDQTRAEHIDDAAHLEHAGAALRVTREGLLRDDEQRVAGGAAQRHADAGVQIRLVGIVGVRGRVVLGHEGHVVDTHAELSEVAGDDRVTSAACHREGTQSGRRNRGVGAVAEGLCVSHDCQDRQVHVERHRRAGQQHGAATLRLDEATAAAVVGARDEARGNAASEQLVRVRRRVHRAEAHDRLDLDVVDRAGHDEVSLASLDLVDALLDGHRGGRAGADRVDHRAVAAHVGLHRVCSHDVGQGLLQDVLRVFLAQEAVNEQLVHRTHATEAGALRGSNGRRVDDAQQFGGAEASGHERVDGGDQVPHGDRVDRVQHRGRDTPASRIEVGGEQATDAAVEGRATRHAHLCAGLAGHLPLTERGLLDHGELRVGLGVGAGLGLILHGERDVAVQEDHRRLGRVAVVQRSVVVEEAHAGAGHDLVAVAIEDPRLGDELVVLVVPAAHGGVRPGQQAGHPGQLEHARRGELDGAVGVDTELGLHAGTSAAPRADLAVTDDDDRVGQRRRGVTPLRRLDVRHGDLRRRGQRGDGRDRLRCGCLGSGGLGLGAQGAQVDGGVQAAGQVGVHRGVGGLGANLGAREREQLLGHFLGRPGTNARSLDGGDHRVVAAHEAGATHPTDTRVSNRHARTPDRLGCPAGRDRVEGSLRLGVRAVAAEDAAVRRTGQHDVQAVVGVRVGADRAQAGDGALDAPQQQAHLVLGGSARVGQRAGDARSGEGVEQCRDQGFLGHLDVGAHGLGLLGTDPLHERIHVAVGGQVRGNQPQLRAAGGVRAVELLGEGQARSGDRRGGRDDGGAPGK